MPLAANTTLKSGNVTPASIVKGTRTGTVRLLTLIDAPKHNKEEIYITRRDFFFFDKVHYALMSHLYSPQTWVNFGM